MLNEFVKFINSDPIMLWLSVAIVVLVFIFILVLIFGGKKKTKSVQENAIDNTQALLKPDLSEDQLRSTQEFSLHLKMSEQQGEPISETYVEEPVKVQTDSVSDNVVPIPVEVENELPTINDVDVKVNEPIFEDSVLPQIKSDNEMSINNNQQFSSVYVENNDSESTNADDVVSPDLDNIELPMLNAGEDTSVLNSLEGEHYNID